MSPFLSPENLHNAMFAWLAEHLTKMPSHHNKQYEIFMNRKPLSDYFISCIFKGGAFVYYFIFFQSVLIPVSRIVFRCRRPWRPVQVDHSSCHHKGLTTISI